MRLVSLKCNKDHFKTVEFKSGLNLILAERTEQSSSTDSRNGAGKTTLFQIIDFCLGGTVRGEDGLGKLIGKDWSFTLELLFDQDLRLRLTRHLDESAELELVGDVVSLGLGEASPAMIRLRAWTGWLGAQCFGMELGQPRGEYDPTFRRLFGHFLRFRADAYVSPFETFAKQPPHQVQTDNAFLLGLDWRLAGDWQRWKDRGKALGVLAKSEMDEVAERLGELESRRVRADAQHRRLAEEVRNFEVLPEYREVERRANELTTSMQRIANEMTLTTRVFQLYRGQLEEGERAESLAVTEMFREAGVVFGQELRRSLDEVTVFHEEVSRNRHDYLSGEIRRLEVLQGARSEELERLEALRKKELTLLESHGALEDFAQLQQRLGILSASIQTMKDQIDELREVRKGKAALKVAQVELQERTALDVEQRIPAIASILEDFSETFEALYGESADLVIDVGDAGYRFRVRLPKQGSHGVGKMGLFAYDLAITDSWAKAGSGVGFLGHDSVVFDGVDERQTAAAIQRAQTAAVQHGFQYVLTINTDDVPFGEMDRVGVDVQGATVLTLTDADVAGGLLGIRV